ncbi:hypothetical protein AU106_gp016 [Sinorhizobium phage phiM9]|uniref:Uncharacterized protein n=1 Tax=Sinorhizobium phage phiM9 TaxID=1636182 RepID=A0A0F6R4U6_9CAUD|nr:hypothetical protein AU106_gp016 [Sinorhizobium phage phiM9]AKE44647.1 hypothetical protein Sm_phiM9_017 [Sinorhizobium phage phiM9]
MSLLTLFVYGEIDDLHLEFARTDDDEDAKCHIMECVSGISHTLSEGALCIGIHIPITQVEFDEWEETGEWNERVSDLLIKRINAVKLNSTEVIPFKGSEDLELEAA